MRLVVAAALAAASLSCPADAIELKAGLAGGMEVGKDFSVCGYVLVPGSTLVTGHLTALGHLQGPGTKVGTVRASEPFTSVGSWSGCIPGSYEGATVGDGKFALSAVTATGEYAHVLQCVINNGDLKCV